MIQIVVPGGRAQVTPEVARELVVQLLEASQAAIGDAFLAGFLSDREKFALRPEHVYGVIAEFREYRAKRFATAERPEVEFVMNDKSAAPPADDDQGSSQ